MNEQWFIQKLPCVVAPVSPNLLKVRFCNVQYRCIFVLVIWTLLCVICTLLRELDNKYLYVPFGRLTQKRESPAQDSRAQLALHYCDKNIYIVSPRIIPLLQGEGTSANIVFLVLRVNVISRKVRCIVRIRIKIAFVLMTKQTLNSCFVSFLFVCLYNFGL